MSNKLLASITVFVLLTGVVSTSLLQSVYATDYGTSDKTAANKAAADKAVADKKAIADKAVADKKAMADRKAAADKKTSEVKNTDTSKTSSNAVTVEMTKGSSSNSNCANKCYTPNTVSIKVGVTVTWKNVDTAAHTVTSGKGAISDGIFDSGMIMAGDSFNYKFDKTGTYDYYCMVHPWMTGSVTVN